MKPGKILIICVLLMMIVGMIFMLRTSRMTSAYQVRTPVPQNAPVSDWISLLTPTSDCPLPCWWDIQPGVTTLDEAEMLLQQRFAGITVTREPLGLDEQQIWGENFRMFVNDQSVSPMVLYLAGQGGITDYVELELPNPLGFGTNSQLAWEYFAIPNLLQIYGTPSLVRLVALHKDGGLYLPGIILYWDAAGMIASYDYLFEETWQPDPAEYVCYGLSNMRSVTIRLQNVASTRTLEELSSDIAAGTARLSDISYLSNEQFAQILIQNNGCFPPDFPADIYATPASSPVYNFAPDDLTPLNSIK